MADNSELQYSQLHNVHIGEDEGVEVNLHVGEEKLPQGEQPHRMSFSDSEQPHGPQLPIRVFDQKLSRRQVAEYAVYVSRNESLFRMITDSCVVKYAFFYGVDEQSLQNLIEKKRRKGEAEIASLLDKLSLATPVEILDDSSLDPHNQKSTLAIAVKRADDKFNIIVAEGTQQRQISPWKLAAYLGATILCAGAVVAGVVFSGGALIPAVVAGAATLGATSLGVAGKLCYDYRSTSKNVFTGFLLNMLQERGVIQVQENGFEFLEHK